jgi:succinoglycan biosynthesis protein ExoA
LAAQYLRYGGWKAEMVRLQPRSIKLRHLVAPVFVLSILILLITGFVFKFAWWLLAIEIAVYLAAALLAGIQVSQRERGGLKLALFMPVVFATIHLSWGASFVGRLLVPKSQ